MDLKGLHSQPQLLGNIQIFKTNYPIFLVKNGVILLRGGGVPKCFIEKGRKLEE